MNPEDIKEGKKYVVSFEDRNRILKLHHKIEYKVKGKGSFWYHLFEEDEGQGLIHVKTIKRIVGPADE